MRRELPQPAIYLDRSVIRGAVRGGMRPRDRAALCRLAAMVHENLLSFRAAADARREIDRIPLEDRRRYRREYEALESLGACSAAWLAERADPMPEQQSELALLQSVVGDEGDAKCLLQAKAAGVRDVVTAASSALLPKARELELQFGLRVFLPADYLSRWSTQQGLVG